MIYLITDDTYVKIGKSKYPLQRIKDLQTSNARTLKFLYVFDLKDQIEKVLHEKFKNNKTDSINEWFDLSNINLDNELKQYDSAMGSFKARQLNNELFKSNIHNSQSRKKIISVLKGDELKIRRTNMLNDIKNHLENNKNKRISYDPYVIKYGFTKAEITYYVKSAGLSNRIFQHNSKV